jgi:hypothetical protein
MLSLHRDSITTKICKQMNESRRLAVRMTSRIRLVQPTK